MSPLRPWEERFPRSSVPVFFFVGRHDFNTPSRLAAEYLERLDTPLKGLVWFEHSAHFPFFEEPDLFHREMVRVQQAVNAFWKERMPGS
jgi:pimeloyl-ACP methyl ester carboxylesterase